MKPGHWLVVLTIITVTFCGCTSNTTQGTALQPGENVDSNTLPDKSTNNGKQKLLDMALKISGKRLSAEERNVVMRMLNLNEEDMIKGLSVCGELSDGRYPSGLDPETVIKETEAWGLVKYGKYDNLPAGQKKEVEKKMYDTFFMASYYKRLVKEHKEPAYCDKVTVEDQNAVLVRWKESESKYRVIFGNLRIETVTADRLAELEKVQLK
jgi:hypothetical protein